MVIPCDRVLAIVRQGATAERLWRLAQSTRPWAFPVIVPDEFRLRPARDLLRGGRAPGFFALECHVAAAGGKDPIWRSLSSGAGISRDWFVV